MQLLKSVFSEDKRVCVTIVGLSTHILCLMVYLGLQNLLILLNKYASPVIALLSCLVNFCCPGIGVFTLFDIILAKFN